MRRTLTRATWCSSLWADAAAGNGIILGAITMAKFDESMRFSLCFDAMKFNN